MPKHPKTVLLEGFKGLNNVLRPENTPPEYLKKADNVDIDKQGNILKRKGYTKVDDGEYTSLWSNYTASKCYAVKDNTLIRINSDLTNSIIESNVDDDVSFEEIGDSIYWVSKNKTGKIFNDINYPFGLPLCSSPSLSATSGTLRAGTYQVSCTFVDISGAESGSSVPQYITLSSNSNIIFTAPNSALSNITSVNVYCSTTDGQRLYFNQNVSLGGSVVISSVNTSATPLRRFNIYPAPSGDEIKYYRGRLYIVEDNILWYSEPLQYEQYQLDRNYIEFTENIINILPVENGIWVGTEKGIYYLSGNTPEEFTMTLKECVKIVKGTPQKFSGSYIQLDNTPIGYKWLVTTDIGIFVLFNQGVIINLTATNLSIDKAIKGTSVFLQAQGLNQYLTILNKNNESNNSVMGDKVTTSIIRNGINIG